MFRAPVDEVTRAARVRPRPTLVGTRAANHMTPVPNLAEEALRT